MVANFNMKALSFLFLKNVALKSHKKNINVNVFRYENRQVYPIYLTEENFEDHMELLLLVNEDKSHYVYIKNFSTFM